MLCNLRTHALICQQIVTFPIIHITFVSKRPIELKVNSQIPTAKVQQHTTHTLKEVDTSQLH